MKTLTFFRHAESEMNTTPNLIGGRSNDIGLSPLGFQQAEQLGKSLTYTTDRIIVSPANRTLLTAKIALRKFGIIQDSFEIDPEIQEISHGEWEGKERSEIYTPEVVKLISEMKGKHKVPRGESQIDVQERMYKRVVTILDEMKDGDEIYLFSHGFSIRSLVQKILGEFEPGEIHKSPDVANTGKTVIQFDNGTFSVPIFNDTSHLKN